MRLAHLLDDAVRFAQVLVAGAVALDQIGNGVQPEAVHTHLQPVLHGLEHRFQYHRVVEVQVGLVAEEAVPEVLLRHLVPGPVGLLGVGEDDARAAVQLGVVGPDVEVAFGRALRRLARRLEPGVLVAGVVHHQFGDDAQAAPVRLDHEGLEVVERAVGRVHAFVVGHVVTVVAQRRRVERQQPDGVDPQRLHMVQALRQAGEVTDAVAIGIGIGLDVQFVDDRVLVPLRIALTQCIAKAVGFDRGFGCQRWPFKGASQRK